MTTLHETEIDGVRCFWVETGRPTLSATLDFRFGLADEPLVESGWQHILEHMALRGRGGGSLDVNGQVSLLGTSFVTHGPVDAVAAHLGEVTRWLSAPRFTDLLSERQVLKAEAQVRANNPTVRALGWRYGARGPGVIAQGEVALSVATPEALWARASHAFGASNAVLALDGPPPPGLRLHLPEGAFVPQQAAVPCEDGLPATYEEYDGVVFSGVVPRSSVMTIGAELLRVELTKRLRHEQGMAYSPWSVYEPVDADNAVIVAGSDLRSDTPPRVTDTAMRAVELLGSGYPDSNEVDRLREARLQALRDPYARFGLAVRAAHQALHRQPVLDFDAVIDEIERVSNVEMREGFRQFNHTLLVGRADPESAAPKLHVLGFGATKPQATGHRFKHVNWPKPRAELVVGKDAVEVRFDGKARTIPTTELACLYRYENGIRGLLRNDGYGVTIEPREWRRGSRAVAMVDAFVPTQLHLPMPALESAAPPLKRRGAFHSHPVLAVPSVLVVILAMVLAVQLDNPLLVWPILGVGLLWFRLLRD